MALLEIFEGIIAYLIWNGETYYAAKQSKMNIVNLSYSGDSLDIVDL